MRLTRLVPLILFLLTSISNLALISRAWIQVRSTAPLTGLQISTLPDASVTPTPSAAPTMAGGGGLLTPEPIETGAPPGPIAHNEDPGFWIAMLLLPILTILVLVKFFRDFRRNSSSQ